MGTVTNQKEKAQAVEAENNTVSDVAQKTARARTKTKPLIPKDIDPTQYVTVRNGFQGRLVYKSKRTGERFVWDGFGSEQEIELRELRNAKNTYKKFFENNWFMFDEDWIIDYLGVRNFYKNAVRIEDFDDIFTKDADTIRSIVSGLSAGQKKSIAYRARQLILTGDIDSNKAITALEESLGVELVER